MIKEFVSAWDANKDYLREYIAAHEQEGYKTYSGIVKMLFERVINPYMTAHDKQTFDLEKVHEIDDGDYQGTLLYIIPFDTYQPSYWEYVVTSVYYGSCSFCDTLQGIHRYEDGLPDKEQVDGYMKLCLDILQHCKYLYKFNEKD